jgi:hypothetical protein
VGIGKKEKIASGSFQSELNGCSGIIYFEDYWRRGGEIFNSCTGDHIDLWSDGKIAGGSMLHRSIIELLDFVLDLNKSKEIWF